MTTDPEPVFKSGFVAIVGAPNAGKSTLLNRMLGQKISITSKKPQTTRNRILGVVHRPGSQIIFLDTPGIHRARSPLHTRIVDAALSTLSEVDLILLVVDVNAPDEPSERLLLGTLGRQRLPVLLALNKIDRVQRPVLLSRIEGWSGAFPFAAVVPISAKTGQQIDRLMAAMEDAISAGPPFFPPDSLTDLPTRFLAAELIREKAFRLTGQEIPYAVAVTIDSFKEEKQGALIRIH
ncbi:MAG: GTPase Era, partial [Desulfosarcina sp.]